MHSHLGIHMVWHDHLQHEHQYMQRLASWNHQILEEMDRMDQAVVPFQEILDVANMVQFADAPEAALAAIHPDVHDVLAAAVADVDVVEVAVDAEVDGGLGVEDAEPEKSDLGTARSVRVEPVVYMAIVKLEGFDGGNL
eukprot:Gb_34766 [translate_table: standard]